MERTLVLLKPDAVQRNLVGEILGRFERKGLKRVGLKQLLVTEELARQHYHSQQGKPYFPAIVAYITSGPVVAVVLEGLNAIRSVRLMMGERNPSKALPGTIRGDLALSVRFNLIHGSDSAETAQYEIALWFQPEELTAWTSLDEHFMQIDETDEE